VARGKSSSRSGKDLWEPKKIDRKAVDDKVTLAVHYLRKIPLDVQRQSILLDLDYNAAFEAVESLYGLLQMDRLAQDNERRKQIHMDAVRKAHGDVS
jgi:hypothetical protein